MKYKFSATDNFFPQNFTGEIEANSKKEAEKELKEFYSYELDTTENQINVKLEKVK